MSDLIQHAERELNLLLDNCKDEDSKSIQKLMNSQILDTIRLISEQCHSGFSINYFKNCLDKLLMYKTLTPLTGKDDEWCLVKGLDLYQNIRCSSVFKNPKTGIAHDIDKVIVSSNGGATWYTGNNKFKDLSVIEFPYIPGEVIKKYIEYTNEDETEWIDITDDKVRIKELYDDFERKVSEVYSE